MHVTSGCQCYVCMVVRWLKRHGRQHVLWSHSYNMDGGPWKTPIRSLIDACQTGTRLVPLVQCRPVRFIHVPTRLSATTLALPHWTRGKKKIAAYEADCRTEIITPISGPIGIPKIVLNLAAQRTSSLILARVGQHRKLITEQHLDLAHQ